MSRATWYRHHHRQPVYQSPEPHDQGVDSPPSLNEPDEGDAEGDSVDEGDGAELVYDDDDDEADEGCHCSKRLLPSGLAISVVVRLFATLAARSHVSRAFMQHVFFIISLILPTALLKDWPDWSQVVYRIEARKNDSEEIHTCVHDHVLFCDDHAELDACPKCGSARYYTDGSVRRPRR